MNLWVTALSQQYELREDLVIETGQVIVVVHYKIKIIFILCIISAHSQQFITVDLDLDLQ